MTEHSEDTPLGPLAGAFPELANLIDADLDWAKQQWQSGLEKQLELMSSESLTDWDRLDAMQIEDIDLSDVPESAEMVAKTVVRRDGQRLSRSLPFQSVLDGSRASITEGNGLPHDDFWRAVTEHTREAADTDQPAGSGDTQSECTKSIRVLVLRPLTGLTTAETDAGENGVQCEDARDMFNRLGNGEKP